MGCEIWNDVYIYRVRACGVCQEYSGEWIAVPSFVCSLHSHINTNTRTQTTFKRNLIKKNARHTVKAAWIYITSVRALLHCVCKHWNQILPQSRMKSRKSSRKKGRKKKIHLKTNSIICFCTFVRAEEYMNTDMANANAHRQQQPVAKLPTFECKWNGPKPLTGSHLSLCKQNCDFFLPSTFSVCASSLQKYFRAFRFLRLHFAQHAVHIIHIINLTVGHACVCVLCMH